MRKLVLKFVVSLLLGGLMLYLAARGISFSGAWNELLEARWGMLVPFFGLMAAQHFFRSWRWGQLLAPIHPVPFRRVLQVASVGFFAVLALPLRMGEFVRPYLIADPPRLRLSHALGTIAVERIFDGLCLSLAAFVAVIVATTGGTEVPKLVFVAGLASLGLFLVALTVLVVTLWQRERAVGLCRRLFSLASARVADRAARIAEGVVDGFRILPMWRRLVGFIGATVIYWLLNAMALWVLARGFDLQLSLGASTGLMGVIGIGIMIPALPGFVGSFELFGKGALAIYLPPQVLQTRGIAFVVATHAANALWYVATGTIAMLSIHVGLAWMLRAARPDRTPQPEPRGDGKHPADTRDDQPTGGLSDGAAPMGLPPDRPRS